MTTRPARHGRMHSFAIKAAWWSLLQHAPLLLLCVLASRPSPTLAQAPPPAIRNPSMPRVSPERLDFGVVRLGATVEGSLRIMVPGANISGISVKTEPPSFLQVPQTRLKTQVVSGNRTPVITYVMCDVFVSLDTSVAGKVDGILKVAVGDEENEIPVTADIQEKQDGRTRVLIVDTPFQGGLAKASMFDPWLELVKSEELDVDYLQVSTQPLQPVLRDLALSRFDVIVVAGSGVSRAQMDDFSRLTTFANDGGRVIMAASVRVIGTVPKANEFLVPLGLRMTNQLAKSGGMATVAVLQEKDITSHALTAGVRTLKFDLPSTVGVVDETKGQILVDSLVVPDAGLVAVARVGKGDVIALGTFVWWQWIASKPESGADNITMLKNMLRRP